MSSWLTDTDAAQVLLLGTAEFQPGQKEQPDEGASVPAAADPVGEETPVIDSTTKADTSSMIGLDLLQKGLFLAVIIACIAAYIRMRKSTPQAQGYEKSLA